MNYFFFFFFNDTATTEIYTLSLHDALPISLDVSRKNAWQVAEEMGEAMPYAIQHLLDRAKWDRSEEHTSELQSPDHLVCRLLLEKKKKFEEMMTTHVRRSMTEKIYDGKREA